MVGFGVLGFGFGFFGFLFAVALMWSIVWKGLALWKAAHLNQKYWFVALLVVNTLGILEILYIYIFSEKAKVKHHEKKEE
ncbi:MAG: hypothetical protein D4Q79_01795 [Spirochaetia bacterium]|nr:MAG: hypothetical protein D4Q79_01795 [Spirochaetia bacterium]